jgi:hypothetical protein
MVGRIYKYFLVGGAEAVRVSFTPEADALVEFWSP